MSTRGFSPKKGKLTLSLEVGRDACAGVEELQLESRMEKLRSVSPKSREPKGLPPGAPRKPLQLPLAVRYSALEHSPTAYPFARNAHLDCTESQARQCRRFF